MSQNNLSNLSEIETSGEFELEGTLNDAWWDFWGFDDEIVKDLDSQIDTFVESVTTKVNETPILKNWENFKKIIRDLGFEEGYSGSWNSLRYKPLDLPHLNKKVILKSWDPVENKLKIEVEKENNRTGHIISPQELSDYVVSDELDMSHEEIDN